MLAVGTSLTTSDFQDQWRRQTHRRIFVLNLELRRHDLILINKKKIRAQVHDTAWKQLHKGDIWMRVRRGQHRIRRAAPGGPQAED